MYLRTLIKDIQGLLPNERCQNTKLILVFLSPWQTVLCSTTIVACCFSAQGKAVSSTFWSPHLKSTYNLQIRSQNRGYTRGPIKTNCYWLLGLLSSLLTSTTPRATCFSSQGKILPFTSWRAYAKFKFNLQNYIGHRISPKKKGFVAVSLTWAAYYL